MSKDLPQQPQPSEEVDLGQLFKMIGNLFDRLFSFLGNVISKLYDVFLLLLIHLFKRFKWYVAVVILGVVIGYFLDKSSLYLYEANMQIETNYGSARQVYENINYLNHLAEIDKDSVELSKRLDISITEAASIKGFHIEPDIDENDKMKLFSDFRAQLDSLTQSTLTYYDYTQGLNSYSFETHLIEVKSTDKFIYSKIGKSLPKELSNNSYLSELRDVTVENLNKKENTLASQKQTIDSLKSVYLEIRKKESEKQINDFGQGTNLFMGETGRGQSLVVDETLLIDRMLNLEEQRLTIYKDLVKEKNVINVISEFPFAGYNIGKFWDKTLVKIPLLLVLITFLIFVLLGLTKYLHKEQKRLMH